MNWKTLGLVSVMSLLAIGCGGDGGDPDGGGDADSGVTDGGGGSDASADAGAMDDAGGGADAGTDGGGGGGGCPTAELPMTTSVTYMGSTIGKPNLFESNRLEWREAGDEALLFRVPETGTYRFALDDGLTTNGGCAVSVSDGAGDMGLHDVAEDCPAAGSVRQLPDAYFVAGEGFEDTIDLTAGTELLVLVSCAYWSNPVTEVDYTLTITRE